MARTWILAGLVLLLTVGGVQAGEEAERARNWGLGWENGLTLRRQLGEWQVGVTAGPNDSLSDHDVTLFENDLPDSLQGIVSSSRSSRTESGYVRLHLARRLASQRTLVLSGVLGGGYSWSDEGSGRSQFYFGDMDWSENRVDLFSETWQLRLGTRVAWYPVPFVSLEAEFGLIYQWNTNESDRWYRNSGEQEWSLEHEANRSHSFRTYDNTDLTYNLHIIFWL
jgi:hypothetical protein